MAERAYTAVLAELDDEGGETECWEYVCPECNNNPLYLALVPGDIMERMPDEWVTCLTCNGRGWVTAQERHGYYVRRRMAYRITYGEEPAGDDEMESERRRATLE